MCWPSPSASSATPISSRNESASILTVGWRCTKSLTGRAATIITPTAMTTAATITPTWRAIPTAVITESSENTMSSITIWPITAANVARPRGLACPCSPSSLSWISKVLFAIRNRPPTMRMRSRPEIGWPSTAKSGAVSRMIHVSDSSRPMRISIASASATRRARPCSLSGSFPARIEMKMMLSMPSTISRTVRVASAIQVSGEVSQAMGETKGYGRSKANAECGHPARRPASGAGSRHQEQHQGDQRVHRDQLNTLVPVALSVTRDHSADEHAEQEEPQLGPVEGELQPFGRDDGAEQHQHRRDEQRDLDARAERDAH